MWRIQNVVCYRITTKAMHIGNRADLRFLLQRRVRKVPVKCGTSVVKPVLPRVTTPSPGVPRTVYQGVSVLLINP